jgi:hypothetical protein
VTDAGAVELIPGKGRAVVAIRAIQAGETVAIAPVVVIPAAERARVHATVLDDYLFAWAETSALALGWGGLFNHSYTPNLVYTRDFTAGNLVFTARRDIAEAEELTINYNGDADRRDPVWFEPR